jgi:pyruvate, orthophosphate dikinase
MAKAKYSYFFGLGPKGENFTEGKADMKDLLGGKGANLAEMASLKLPVPPGFTITTEVCTHYYQNKQSYPQGLREEVAESLKKLESCMGLKFGDSAKPLLVSVRSGARASMPGMMDTVLNLGLNDQSVEGLAQMTGNARFAYDSYRRFIQMYSDVVLNVHVSQFESLLEELKADRKVAKDSELKA